MEYKLTECCRWYFSLRKGLQEPIGMYLAEECYPHYDENIGRQRDPNDRIDIEWSQEGSQLRPTSRKACRPGIGNRTLWDPTVREE